MKVLLQVLSYYSTPGPPITIATVTISVTAHEWGPTAIGRRIYCYRAVSLGLRTLRNRWPGGAFGHPGLIFRGWPLFDDFLYFFRLRVSSGGGGGASLNFLIARSRSMVFL